MYTFVILATIEASDRFEDIRPGDILHQGEANRQFDSETAAVRAGERVLHILGGGRSFNQARASAEIVAVNVGDRSTAGAGLGTNVHSEQPAPWLIGTAKS